MRKLSFLSIQHGTLVQCTVLNAIFIAFAGLSFGQDQKVVAEGAWLKKVASGMKFTEGPVWLPRDQKLIFSDIPNSKLMEWSGESGLSVFREDSNQTNGNILDLDGWLISCRHRARDLVRRKVDGSNDVLADRFQGKRFHSPNDVAVKSDGSLWFTDPPWGLNGRKREVSGHWVYRLAPDGTVSVVCQDLAMPNGIVFSPGEKTVYISDTGGYKLVLDRNLRNAPAKVHLFRVNDDQTITRLNKSLDVRCDGMCVDVKGNVYTTTNEGVVVFDSNGNRIATIKTPEGAANACFGGSDYKTLFITARTSLYSIQLSNAGAKPPGSKW